MSHYAQVKNGTVQQVIVAEADFIATLSDAADWIQTSYRTRGNQHPEGRPLRGNYAGAGYTYDARHDVFYPAQPYASWTLNTSTWTWQSPVAYPDDNESYRWDESTQTWIQNGS
jgi:hypothetical protein